MCNFSNPHPLAGVAQRMGALGGGAGTPPPETWQRVGQQGVPPSQGQTPMPQPNGMQVPPMMPSTFAQPTTPDELPVRQPAPVGQRRYINER